MQHTIGSTSTTTEHYVIFHFHQMRRKRVSFLRGAQKGQQILLRG